MKLIDILLEFDIGDVYADQMPYDVKRLKKISNNTYEHPKSRNKVVHIIDIGTSVLESTPLYSFLQAIEKNQLNPFFPKIHDVKQVSNNRGNNLVFITSERLKKISSSSFDRSMVLDVLSSMGLEVDQDSTPEQVLSDLNQRATNDREYFNYIRMNSKNPQFVKALRALMGTGSKGLLSLSADSWNIRLTGNGIQPVITDPTQMVQQ